MSLALSAFPLSECPRELFTGICPGIGRFFLGSIDTTANTFLFIGNGCLWAVDYTINRRNNSEYWESVLFHGVAASVGGFAALSGLVQVATLGCQNLDQFVAKTL